jgi:hypothetical protein
VCLRLSPANPGVSGSRHFINQDYVFSDHFHMRKKHEKVVHTVNVIPFNFADTQGLLWRA